MQHNSCNIQGPEAGEPAAGRQRLPEDGGLRLREAHAARGEDVHAVRHPRVPGAGAGHPGRPHRRRRLVGPASVCVVWLHCWRVATYFISGSITLSPLRDLAVEYVTVRMQELRDQDLQELCVL